MPFCLNSKRFSFRLLPQISYVNTLYWFCKQKLSFSTIQLENFVKLTHSKIPNKISSKSQNHLCQFNFTGKLPKQKRPNTKQWFFREIDLTFNWILFCLRIFSAKLNWHKWFWPNFSLTYWIRQLNRIFRGRLRKQKRLFPSCLKCWKEFRGWKGVEILWRGTRRRSR